ncbi:acyl-CoA dehydrogenase family protein [Kineococcus rhizosphaerae]|uniref:Alkylation response protein AidB-like acyl-CoA dehydrogenase n=1 Tax=Kineococcus rhizosphaerae TaxID=559628 RepID=A0A2T0RAU7_9ACTN|nr:acyl-CoA dehydrogenase family protein [Kineococcus rhizosphaerae]PRY18285.1 alkylation response protein AidB-like acyl-CoA dehydrogenase [Kineococcus rhizosphaerae]
MTTSTIHESPLSTETGRQIRDGVLALVPQIRAAAREGEKLGCLPPATLNALAELDVFRLSIPEKFGGLALGARDLAEIILAVARADGSAGWQTMISSGFTRVVLTFPEETVAEVFEKTKTWEGPIVASASLFSDRIQRATKVPGGHVVAAGGKWGFGSGSKHAAHMVVGVGVEQPDGGFDRLAVLLDKGQYEIVDDWHVMGLSGSSSNSVTITEDVFVPDSRVVPLAELTDRLDAVRTKYEGLGLSMDARGLMIIVTLETMGIAVGMAEGAFDCFLEQTRNKKPFTLDYPSLQETPGTQIVAGKVRSMINAARELVLAKADVIDRKAQAGEPFTAAEETALQMDFVYAGNLAGQAIEQIQFAIGSATVALSNPIQRYARDVRVALTHGSNRLDPSAELAGRDIFGVSKATGGMAGTPGVQKANERTPVLAGAGKD